MLKIFIILQYQEEKVGAQDVDSAEMLAIKKDRKIIVDSNTFSNVIRLVVFLITEKLVNFTSVHFVSAKYYSEYGNTKFKIDQFTVVSGSSLREFEM